MTTVFLALENVVNKFSVVNESLCLNEVDNSCFIEDIHEFEKIFDGYGWHAFIQSVQNYLGSFLI